MTFAELQNIVEPYGFVIRKNFSSSKTNKHAEPQAYMASVSLEKSEFPTWIDGISMSVEFVKDEMLDTLLVRNEFTETDYTILKSEKYYSEVVNGIDYYEENEEDGE